MCNKCKIEKNCVDFYRNKCMLDGLSNYCKKCFYMIANKYAKTNNYKHSRQWAITNIKKMRAIRIKSYRKRRLDPTYRIRRNVSGAIRSFSKNNYSTIWSKLPYTPAQLKDHLQSLWEPWMSWDNYGKLKGCWNIDHIIPQSVLPFDSLDHPNFLQCWSLQNLRPLDASTNYRIGAMLRH